MLKMWGGMNGECVRFRHGEKQDVNVCLVYERQRTGGKRLAVDARSAHIIHFYTEFVRP